MWRGECALGRVFLQLSSTPVCRKDKPLSASRTSLCRPQGQAFVGRKDKPLSAARQLFVCRKDKSRGKSLTSCTSVACGAENVLWDAFSFNFPQPLSAARTSLCRPQGQAFVGLKDKPLSAARTSLCLPQGQVFVCRKDKPLSASRTSLCRRREC